MMALVENSKLVLVTLIQDNWHIAANNNNANAHFLASDFSSELVKSAYNLLLPLHSSRR